MLGHLEVTIVIIMRVIIVILTTGEVLQYLHLHQLDRQELRHQLTRLDLKNLIIIIPEELGHQPTQCIHPDQEHHHLNQEDQVEHHLLMSVQG